MRNPMEMTMRALRTRQQNGFAQFGQVNINVLDMGLVPFGEPIVKRRSDRESNPHGPDSFHLSVALQVIYGCHNVMTSGDGKKIHTESFKAGDFLWCCDFKLPTIPVGAHDGLTHTRQQHWSQQDDKTGAIFQRFLVTGFAPAELTDLSQFGFVPIDPS